MTQPSRVIYLPPGVVAGTPLPHPAATIGSGLPFDRNFFENILPPSIAGFCQQVKCQVPVVEVSTVDGMTHYVKGISGLADTWVALQTASPEHTHPRQVFVPYQTIYRVEIHPEEDEGRRHLGFVTPPPAAPRVARKPANRRAPKDVTPKA
ncbi:MAG: hypothetical protein M9925_01665 [Chloroflexi bacterium]|jgi:hypothetical protein|nr:hypothetical protein [Dehalococcoidia bacterium]MCO5200402.1 hypothetical protein [Chloroflexota bacterium]MCZ7576034.1 hypothetical protein [Dehalococcoidia bacterium]NJD66451.1 hypothetical protein [Chloroflexota bacterium]PWB43317.1 MAG: hypothetical protein C3F10_11540 [Dehalococcoidia bacterium]